MTPPSSTPILEPVPAAVCGCARSAVTLLAGPDSAPAVPWCGANNPPPLPGSRQALEQAAQYVTDNEWHLDRERGTAALARLTALAYELATLGDLAEFADKLEELADQLDDLCAEHRTDV